METKTLLANLSNPRHYEVGVISPRSYKQTYDLTNKHLYQSLNGQYWFNFCPDLVGRDERFWENYQQFKTITVPTNIELNGFGQIQYVNTQYPWDGVETVTTEEMPTAINYAGQYVKHFIHYSQADSKYHLVFDGVESCFNVWINGEYVGFYEDSFTRSEFDITPLLIQGENTLAVEVYKYSIGSWLNDQDFWRLSGIFRDVGIIEISKNSIIDFTVNYELNQDLTTCDLIIDLQTNSDFTTNYQLFDPSNQLIASGQASTKLAYQISSPLLWNPESPSLYQLHLMTPTEQFTYYFGIRKIEIVGNQLKFNNRKLILKGVNRHEFDSRVGRAISYEHTYNQLLHLKTLNVNAIRTSHYPNHPQFYQLCDKLGFIVIDEVNLETHGTWAKPDHSNLLPDNHPGFRQRVLQRGENMYQRDKNFTSILFWSLGNESFGGETLADLGEYFRTVDQGRIVHYEGICFDRRFPLTSDVESQMYTTSENVQKFIQEHPEKPFILCEFSHAMGNSNGNFEDYIQLLTDIPNYHGGFIWEYNEQIIWDDQRYKYGGDFQDRPTDGQFICDGLISDHNPDSSEANYIKRLYSPLQIRIEDEHLIVENKNMFTALENVQVQVLEANLNGQHLIEHFRMTIPVGEPVKIKQINAKECLVYTFQHNNQLLQTVSIPRSPEHLSLPEKDLKFVEGDLNIGLYHDDFQVIFGRNSGMITSLKYDQFEVFANIDSGFVPNFYRAVTNNDIGSKHHRKLGILNYISYHQSSKLKSYNYTNGTLQVITEFFAEGISDYHSQIEYLVSSNGEISVELTVDKLPTDQMFNLGVMASLNPEYTRYQYLGTGPEDTYIDRQQGVAKSYFADEVKRECPYVVPQEFGNHTQVELLQITTPLHEQIVIYGDNFEFSLRSYSDIQLTQTRNVADLSLEPPFLRINQIQSGVGGDDSWETWCKDKYIARLSAVNSLKFTIRKQ